MTLLKQLTARPGGEAWLARVGGRLAIVARVRSEPGPRVVCRLPTDPPWAVEHLVEIFCRAAGPA